VRLGGALNIICSRKWETPPDRGLLVATAGRHVELCRDASALGHITAKQTATHWERVAEERNPAIRRRGARGVILVSDAIGKKLPSALRGPIATRGNQLDRRKAPAASRIWPVVTPSISSRTSSSVVPCLHTKVTADHRAPNPGTLNAA